MTGRVVQVESGSRFADNQRRVTIRFESADRAFDTVRFPESALRDGAKLELDNVVSVDIARVTLGIEAAHGS